MSDCTVPMKNYEKPLGRDQIGRPIYKGDWVKDPGGDIGRAIDIRDEMQDLLGEIYIHYYNEEKLMHYLRLDRTLLVLDEEEI